RTVPPTAAAAATAIRPDSATAIRSGSAAAIRPGSTAANNRTTGSTDSHARCYVLMRQRNKPGIPFIFLDWRNSGCACQQRVHMGRFQRCGVDNDNIGSQRIW
ncbi:MAG: hypothetical protein JRI22_16060, partial [Deltaproteobacteria bacterium]|nr:hypothetical protein [Deltaproteobacteria bacterium]